MTKRAVVNGFLGLLLAASAAWGGERSFLGSESGVSVRSTAKNYYIATLLGETEHYAPTFYDDYLVTISGRPVVHFTKIEGKPVDFYWYVSEPEDLAHVEKVFRAEKAAVDAAAPALFDSLAQYRAVQPAYERTGLYGQALATIKDITAVAPQKVVGDGNFSVDVDAALYRYLRSNGVAKLEDLRHRPALINMVVNKFYMLSTTYFYRDHPYVKEFLSYLEPIKERLQKERRPFKAKIFACSTGEEVVTYAIELLEAGIRDFTILASDINDSALRHAEGMRYSAAGLARLTSAAQERIKRHFRLNEKLGVWEPKDPEFFKARIKYMHQDLLKDLPADLPPQFAPPYDLVSIMNVLFYLDDPSVQSRKDGWVRMLAPDGILVLHDFHYSVMTGTLGHDWAFQNFLAVNEWVNVKVDRFASKDEKIRFLEANHRRQMSEGTLLSLVQAYMSASRMDKAAKACETYLEKRPRSSMSLSLLWEIHTQRQNHAGAADALARMVQVSPHSVDTLVKLSDAEKDRKEKEFLRALLKAHKTLVAGRRGRADRMEAIFDFKEPQTKKYETIRSVLKVYGLSMLENQAFARKSPADGERLALEAFRQAEALFSTMPGDPVIAYFLDQVVTDLLDYYLEEGAVEKLLKTADHVATTFLPKFKDAESFHVHALHAHLRLYRALALKSLGRLPEARSDVEEALQHFDRAIPLIHELLSPRRPFFLGDAGRAWMTRAELRPSGGRASHADNERALLLLEEGLSYNPLYGKSLFKWRETLLEGLRAQREENLGGLAPLEGYLIRFKDDYGAHSYKSEIVRYKSKDGANIEATLLTPSQADAPPRVGLVFVHMWARDRNTWWGFPEFMASHGYPSITMDIRGHGASQYPGDSKRRVTIRDTHQESYPSFVNDVLPAMDMLSKHPSVLDGKMVVLGASLGCPVGVIAAEKQVSKVVGMVMLAPAINFLGVDCRLALGALQDVPLFVMAEKTDNSYRGAREFFDVAQSYKTWLKVDHLGHGTDALFRDAGLPTVILSWIQNLESALPSLRRLLSSHPLRKK